MLTVYVFCLAGGGLSIALSVLGVGVLDPARATGFFGGRAVVFGAALFGLTGALFTLLGVGWPLTLAFAVAWGVVAAASTRQWVGSMVRGGEGEIESGADPSTHGSGVPHQAAGVKHRARQ